MLRNFTTHDENGVKGHREGSLELQPKAAMHVEYYLSELHHPIIAFRHSKATFH
jgi:hypothetical protein